VSSPLGEAISQLGIELTEEQVRELEQFRDLLAVSANEFNLTSLRDPEGIERRHLIESLAFGAFLQKHGLLSQDDATGRRVLDIGTGAGLPGIPVKIAWPSMHLTLLESVGKKCRFLEKARDELGLENVEVYEGRAEDFGREPAHRESYDLAIARAVAPLPVLLEYALPALRVGGWLAAPKGSAALTELEAAGNALEALSGRLHDAAPFQPPEGLRQTVLLIEKTAPTPDRYPRRPGIPSKRPL
jgi:16S rRNA (guanine527-N7)-methyltransferase